MGDKFALLLWGATTKATWRPPLTLFLARNESRARNVYERRLDRLHVPDHKADRVVYLFFPGPIPSSSPNFNSNFNSNNPNPNSV